MTKERKKTWDNKVDLVYASFQRCQNNPQFSKEFYNNLFFLNPIIKNYFKNTDFKHQEKALLRGLKFCLEFLKKENNNARIQVIRLSQSHSREGLNIHPHLYYYWIEAVVLTAKSCDSSWYDDLEYYWREVVFYPVSFIISQWAEKVST